MVLQINTFGLTPVLGLKGGYHQHGDLAESHAFKLSSVCCRNAKAVSYAVRSEEWLQWSPPAGLLLHFPSQFHGLLNSPIHLW